jgi:anti-sigma-K factor RskA
MTPDSSTHPHDDLAVYALDALEPEERAAIDVHLAGCAACRAELDGYLATLGQMTVPEEPPDRVWEGISRQIRADGALADTAAPKAPRPPAVVRLDERRPGRARILLAAAAAVVVILGIGALTLRSGDSDSVRELADAAADDPASTVVGLSADGQNTVARIVLTDSDNDYVVFDELPELPSDDTYQLWRTDEGAPVSLGLLGDAADGAAELSLPDDAVTFAVSREPAGGSPQPTDIIAS